MGELHSIGVTEEFRNSVELVGTQFVLEGLLRARRKSWDALHAMRAELKEGLTESEAKTLVLEAFSGFGVSKHWHKPHVRFGPGTTLNFNHPIQKDYRLKYGDPFYFDLGPVWSYGGLDYEGDVGDTFVFGQNPEADKCSQTARTLFSEIQAEWRDNKLSGQDIYRLLEDRARSRGYKLVENVSGHRLSDYPHSRYSKQNLATISFPPTGSLWVLEIHIAHPTLPIGAFFEDLL